MERKLYKEQQFVELVTRINAERMVSVCDGMLTIIYPEKGTLPDMGQSNYFMISHSLKRLK